MEYRYSHVIDPKSYEKAGTIRLRRDWRKYVGPLPDTTYGGNIGPVYSFTSVTIPECLPDRLEIVSYMMELGFLHDDLTETSKVDEGGSVKDQILSGFRNELAQNEGSPKSSGEEYIIKNLMKELIAIDPLRAKEVADYWTRSLSPRQGQTHFTDLEDYLEHRVIDCGSLFLIGLATFGMCLTIPAEEKEECFRLSRPVWAAAALTNDVQSWNKEWKMVGTQDKNDMVNGVWVLMKQHSVDVDTAKDMVLEKVRYLVAEYVDTVKNIHDMDGLSLDSKRFIEAMQYMISGNLVWGISTPRYHPDCTLTDLQISQMKHGRLIDHNETHELQNESLTINGTPGLSNRDVFTSTTTSSLSSTVVQLPAQYIASLPSKNVRDKTIDALNSWLSVSEGDTAKIKCIVNLLHNASLLLDDIEDCSQIRRGNASVHAVFGISQTINSAGHQIIEAMHQVRQLGASKCLDIFEDEIRKLYVGQSYDLFWTHSTTCPSMGDYVKMVDHKTGSLFHLLARLLTTVSTSSIRPNLMTLMALLGRYFQIRDDFMNLSSSESTVQKVFCEDLDEGKYSLPVIHAIQTSSEDKALLLRNVLAQRRATGNLSIMQKQLILTELEKTGSLEYTKTVLGNLYDAIIAELHDIECICGSANPQFMRLIQELKL